MNVGLETYVISSIILSFYLAQLWIEVIIQQRRVRSFQVLMIHRLSHSNLQSIRTCASYLNEVPERRHPPFCFSSSFTNTSLSLTDGDEDALHFWRSLEMSDFFTTGPLPSIYSRILRNGMRVVAMMDGGWVCSTLSPPDFQNMSQHRKMIFSLFVSVGISIRMGIFCQIYTKYKSLINILSSHPWNRAKSLNILSNDLWMEILHLISLFPNAILLSDQFPVVRSLRSELIVSIFPPFSSPHIKGGMNKSAMKKRENGCFTVSEEMQYL